MPSAAACAACTSMSYKAPEGILGEVFTNEGTGTLIVADVNALTPAEQQVGK